MEENIFPLPTEINKEKIKACKCVYCGYVFGEIDDMEEDEYSRFIDAQELV